MQGKCRGNNRAIAKKIETQVNLVDETKVLTSIIKENMFFLQFRKTDLPEQHELQFALFFHSHQSCVSPFGWLQVHIDFIHQQPEQPASLSSENPFTDSKPRKQNKNNSFSSEKDRAHNFNLHLSKR